MRGYKLNLSQAERKRRAKRGAHARNFVDREKQKAAVRQTGINNGLNPTEAQRENGREMAKRNVLTGQIHYPPHVRHHVKDGKTPTKPCRHCNPELFVGETIYQPKEDQ